VGAEEVARKEVTKEARGLAQTCSASGAAGPTCSWRLGEGNKGIVRRKTTTCLFCSGHGKGK